MYHHVMSHFSRLLFQPDKWIFCHFLCNCLRRNVPEYHNCEPNTRSQAKRSIALAPNQDWSVCQCNTQAKIPGAGFRQKLPRSRHMLCSLTAMHAVGVLDFTAFLLLCVT